jgi:hypothetical protein
MAGFSDAVRLWGNRGGTGWGAGFWDRESPSTEDSTLLTGPVVPAWIVALFGAAVVVSGVLYFVLRIRRARRQGHFSQSTARRG